MFFSGSTLGFYSSEIHGEAIPNDAVEISSEVYADLIAGQSAGKVIMSDNQGRPVLQYPMPVPLSRAQIEEQRLRAYADPLIGSDRYFAEAQRESLLGNAEVAEAAKTLGMARFAEIQAEYPWPVD